MWWLVWVVLVIGTLVGAFFLLRDLWRKAQRLARVAGESAETLGAVSARIQEAMDAAEQPDTSPVVFENVAILQRRVDARAHLKQHRKEAKALARQERAKMWNLDTWLAERKQARGEAG
ncbi:MAG: hypothetical protein LBH13_08470 [Cellulomonadaceae bacterium]|jgi:hypothetical protein|nr:hypothetical protein [Cellulomonadaceae bacterium]